MDGTAHELKLIQRMIAAQLQEIYYKTYEDNIKWSMELDAILANCPGYLAKAGS
jgi:hypothetical protein